MVILAVAGISLIAASYVFFVLTAVSPQAPQQVLPPAGMHGAAVGNFQGSAIGNPAPDFSLADMQGKTVTLSAMKGKTVVLFFNEGSMCYPSCWNQVKEFALDARFNNEKVETFSIVVDEKGNWEKIAQSFPEYENAKLLFDSTGNVSAAYGALNMPSSMHGGMMPGHTYYVIDKGGVLRYIFDDPQMGVRNEMIAAEVAKLA